MNNINFGTGVSKRFQFLIALATGILLMRKGIEKWQR